MLKYSITYQITTPESVEDGDFSEQGYEIQDETLDTFRDLVRTIKDRGFSEFCGNWFSTPDPEINYRTGENTFYCLHIDNNNVLKHLVSYLKAIKYIR